MPSGADVQCRRKNYVRILGPLLIVSLLLTSGGVVVRAEADSGIEPGLGQTPVTDAEQEVCEVPVRVHVKARNPLAGALRDARAVIDLNTRGYNYLRPGDYRPRVPAAADGSATPAAPARD
jgi:hypothetical protein